MICILSQYNIDSIEFSLCWLRLAAVVLLMGYFFCVQRAHFISLFHSGGGCFVYASDYKRARVYFIEKFSVFTQVEDECCCLVKTDLITNSEYVSFSGRKDFTVAMRGRLLCLCVCARWIS